MRKLTVVLALVCALFWLSGYSVKAQTNVDEETPLEVQIAANKYGTQYDVCPELIEAICYFESRYTADIENGSCKGIMQINEPVQKERIEKLGVTDIYDLEGNILVGTDLLAELFAQYDDAGIVLGLYHGEKTAVIRGKSGNYSGYTKKILEKSAELERLHGK